jgi:hypothetical protein
MIFDTHGVILEFRENGPFVWLHIQTSFELANSDGNQRLDPGRGSRTLQPALSLLGRRVLNTAVMSAGEIRVRFRGGFSIRVPAHARWEAWELRANTSLVVCMPGGSLAAWTNLPDQPAWESATVPPAPSSNLRRP